MDLFGTMIEVTSEMIKTMAPSVGVQVGDDTVSNCITGSSTGSSTAVFPLACIKPPRAPGAAWIHAVHADGWPAVAGSSRLQQALGLPAVAGCSRLLAGWQ